MRIKNFASIACAGSDRSYCVFVDDFNFKLSPQETNDKNELLLGKIRMPDSPNQKEGTYNELEIKVRYIKDGMGSAGGRGFYLTIHGYTMDPPFRSFGLMRDPSVYILARSCGRFSAKVLKEVAAEVCQSEAFKAKISEIVNTSKAHYLYMQRL